jgi:4-aminobutyrate aminotransferase/(S)-3-amino-2-methylpropionate transaminase
MDICHKHRVLFIADEVQSGFGRTAKMFACEHYGIEPDLIVTAKSLGGGLPLAAPSPAIHCPARPPTQ